MQGNRHQADHHSNYFDELQARGRNVFPAFHNGIIRKLTTLTFVAGLDWDGCRSYTQSDPRHGLFRKEVIQPQVLLRLPCYDFTPIMSHTLGACLLAVSAATSSTTHFRDVTGGVYKARERIHGVDLIRHY